jgi:ActR/RegA family two-component response regulator
VALSRGASLTDQNSLSRPAPAARPARTRPVPSQAAPRHGCSHSELELAALQLRAIDTWNRARRMAEEAAAAGAKSREMRMDLDRRVEVLRAQHHAIVARTEQSLERSVHVMRRTAPRRAVVAHRNEWFVNKLCGDLTRRGIEVVGRFDNGAEAVGVAVAEQPDLVVVEDRLAMVSGEDVVREVRQYVPTSLIAAQVAYEDRIAVMLEAGADTAYARRVPPADVSLDLVRLLTEDLQDA